MITIQKAGLVDSAFYRHRKVFTDVGRNGFSYVFVCESNRDVCVPEKHGRR